MLWSLILYAACSIIVLLVCLRRFCCGGEIGGGAGGKYVSGGFLILTWIAFVVLVSLFVYGIINIKLLPDNAPTGVITAPAADTTVAPSETNAPSEMNESTVHSWVGDIGSTADTSDSVGALLL